MEEAPQGSSSRSSAAPMAGFWVWDTAPSTCGPDPRAPARPNLAPSRGGGSLGGSSGEAGAANTLLHALPFPSGKAKYNFWFIFRADVTLEILSNLFSKPSVLKEHPERAGATCMDRAPSPTSLLGEKKKSGGCSCALPTLCLAKQRSQKRSRVYFCPSYPKLEREDL